MKALAGACKKLAVRVLDSVNEGCPIKVLGQEETELKVDNDALTQQCKALVMRLQHSVGANCIRLIWIMAL